MSLLSLRPAVTDPDGYGVQHDATVPSVPGALRPVAATVAAADARGIQITGVKYISDHVAARKQLRLVITIRDNYGRLIRDAIVLVRQLPGSESTVSAALADVSNQIGQARLTVPLTAPMLGRRLDFLISARTPRAQSREIGSIRLPARRA